MKSLVHTSILQLAQELHSSEWINNSLVHSRRYVNVDGVVSAKIFYFIIYIGQYHLRYIGCHKSYIAPFWSETLITSKRYRGKKFSIQQILSISLIFRTLPDSYMSRNKVLKFLHQIISAVRNNKTNFRIKRFASFVLTLLLGNSILFTLKLQSKYTPTSIILKVVRPFGEDARFARDWEKYIIYCNNIGL